MNKAELITKVAEDTSLTQHDAERAVNALLSAVEGALVEGEKVTLVGFGSFKVHNRAGRTGRNPRTGEAIQINPKKVVKFKAGTRLLANIR